ncbi:MAG: hydantoinase B/oxoprolinase family protein [Candidatus Thermoplasmatota archaeon]
MDPVELEVLRNAVTFVPEEMGIALRRTAYSPNIKERMDASCAVFNGEGRMLAQAEHIPVHLGSMPVTIDVLREEMGGDLADGDQVIVNDPYRGGSHLPDITLVRPIFYRGTLRGYAVNKAHHADVGGSAPGSMPADSVVLADEGIVIPPTKFLRRGEEVRAVVQEIIRGTRNPRERLGDLRAQVAANELGASRFLSLLTKYGATRIDTFASEILAYSERRVRAAIAAMPRGTWRARDVLEDSRDDGFLPIAAEVTVGGSGILVDFEGTSRQIEGNLNAPLSVTLSATYYVFRCLTDPEAPANSGCYAPIAVHAPHGSLVNPRPPAPVAAGNVETSSRIVDVLLLAMAEALPGVVPAQSQGTMNNLLIGGRWRSQDFSYYETIAGGEGAFPFREGQSGIHTHMTNTKNTPVEALELAYPLRVEEYRLIPQSGGAGRHRGGDGIRRSIRFLADRGTLTIISDRRRRGPAGLAGGRDGRRGRNRLIRGGRPAALPGKTTREVRRGDVVVVESPGGGGWGRPAVREGQAP